MIRAQNVGLLKPRMVAMTILLIGHQAMALPIPRSINDSLNAGIVLENRSRHIRAMEIRAGFYSRILASVDPNAAEVQEIAGARDAALQAARFSGKSGEDARNDFYVGWRIGGWCIRAGKVATWRSFDVDEDSLPESPAADSAPNGPVESPVAPAADEALRGGPNNGIHVQSGMLDLGDGATRSLTGTGAGPKDDLRIRRDSSPLYLKLYEKGVSLFYASPDVLQLIIALQRANPANGDVNFLLGRQYEQTGSLRLAATFYTLAAELDPEDAAASLCAGRLLRRLGDAAKADRYLKRASELERTTPGRSDRDKQS